MIIFFTGAGISAESGLRTFRDSDGLWENYNINDVATIEAWHRNKNKVLEFYNIRRRQASKALPNDAHKYVALISNKYDSRVITQNIDNLHEKAGTKNVLHLHGNIFEACSEIDKKYVELCFDDINLGNKAQDGSQLRPNIVWFGEAVPAMEEAISLCTKANIFIIIGTSLQVYPAASLVNYLPINTPIIVVDKIKPQGLSNYDLANITFIEATATTGVIKLNEVLMPLLS